MSKLNLTAESSTYEQHFNDLQQAIIDADLAYKKQEMVLNDSKLFSKNQLDAALQRVATRWAGYTGVSFVIGMIVAYLLCRL